MNWHYEPMLKVTNRKVYAKLESHCKVQKTTTGVMISSLTTSRIIPCEIRPTDEGRDQQMC